MGIWLICLSCWLRCSWFRSSSTTTTHDATYTHHKYILCVPLMQIAPIHHFCVRWVFFSSSISVKKNDTLKATDDCWHYRLFFNSQFNFLWCAGEKMQRFSYEWEKLKKKMWVHASDLIFLPSFILLILFLYKHLSFDKHRCYTQLVQRSVWFVCFLCSVSSFGFESMEWRFILALTIQYYSY